MKGFINLTHTNNGKIAKAKSELQDEMNEKFYNKYQIQQLIANLAGITFKKVEVLPTENILTNVIYLVPIAGAGEQNLYEEYMYIDELWEKIGTTAIDLSNYVSLEEFNDLVNNKTIINTTTYNSFYTGGANKTASTISMVAIGKNAGATSGGTSFNVAVGYNAKISGSSYCAQLGQGTNTKANTLQIFNDNIYNHETHTATFQNLELNGENILNLFPTIEEIDDDEEV